MKFLYAILASIIISLSGFPQNNYYAYNPMTAPGAVSVSTQGHILYWENPESVAFNEVYFSEDSSLVANMDPSVRILSGEPSSVYDSVQISGTLPLNTKYYWGVVEYYLVGNNTVKGFDIPVWYFYTVPPFDYNFYTFDNDLQGWQAVGPQGVNNWFWSNSSNAQAFPGEMVFAGDPPFTGSSHIISPEFHIPAGYDFTIDFHYYLDFNSDTAKVEFGITTDNGNTWYPLWGLHATGNVGPDIAFPDLSSPGNFRMGFYNTGNPASINYFYVDDVMPIIPLTIGAYPPSQLKAIASYTEKQVVLNWDAGSSIDTISGYRIQRQDGLPEDNNPYITIAETGNSTFSFIDTSVNLDQDYTYRVATFNFAYHSYYSNEATAYVPAVTPVELVSFSAAVSGDRVILNWTTATETNNRGFEVERVQRDLGSLRGDGRG